MMCLQCAAMDSRQFTCVGCHEMILDQFVLRVAPDMEWHVACLRCSDCQQLLDETCTCFVRDGKVYCKPDYIRSVSSSSTTGLDARGRGPGQEPTPCTQPGHPSVRYRLSNESWRNVESCAYSSAAVHTVTRLLWLLCWFRMG